MPWDKITLGVIPFLYAKVTSLRFFESGYQPTEMGARAYADQFHLAGKSSFSAGIFPGWFLLFLAPPVISTLG